MRIRISHPIFSSVELRGETLIIHSMQDEARVLRENVEDVVVSVRGKRIRIVAFINSNYAWFFSGVEEIQSERLELGGPYGGGGQLITDDLGNSHLFYFVKQSAGHGALLRHQRYSEEWSKPQTVSTNVFPDGSSFSVSWHNDHFLHLVYLSHKEQHLLYRVYNLEHGVWSGAVTFSEMSSSYPQLISAGNLYLFWQEDGERIDLKVREKEQNWSSATLLSSGEHHAANVGYACLEDVWNVFWVEGSDFYQAPFGKWSKHQKVAREEFEYTWLVHGGLTIPVYEAKERLKPEPEPVEQPIQEQSSQIDEHALLEAQAREKEQRIRQAEEAKLQAAFIEKAFQTLQEWEKLREEMQEWHRLRQEIQKWQREFKLPDPVDITPLTIRVERLERRLLTIKQRQDQTKQEWENNAGEMANELARTKLRLSELEDTEKRRTLTFWQRVLGRG